MNDPFFSVSSRRKLVGHGTNAVSNRPNRNIKSLKNMKTSEMVQKRHTRPKVTTTTLVPLKEVSSSYSESDANDILSQDENNDDDDAGMRIKIAKKYISIVYFLAICRINFKGWH